MCCVGHAGAASNSSQVELPSTRQAGNATDTMSNMLLSGQSSASAHTLDTPEKPKPAAVHSSRPVHIRCKQAPKAEAAESGPERMVMSGDLGRQVLPFHCAERKEEKRPHHSALI